MGNDGEKESAHSNDNNNDNYLNMSTNGSLTKVQIISNDIVKYDNIKNVRPIHNNQPISYEPMEIIPMIQL
jgi:hypothetical protein